MRLSVIGWPIQHSLSPVMHGAALERLSEAEPSFSSWRYEREAVAPADLAAFVTGARGDPDRVGFNVTIPHKVAIAPLLDRLTASAERTGAVNTVRRQGEALVGDNTDAEGLMRALDEAGVRLTGTAVVLGAGGAARAATVGLLDRGVQVHVAARDIGAAQTVASLGADRATWSALTAEALLAVSPSLVVQATSASMDEAAGRALAELVPLERWRRDDGSLVVVDLVYRPRITPLLARAASLDLAVVDGVGMLVHQGALALGAWTGRRIDVAAMRAAVIAALVQGG